MPFHTGGSSIQASTTMSSTMEKRFVVVTLRVTPCSLVFEGEAMEEFVNSAWRGQRTSEERDPFGREEKATRRAERNFAPPQLEVFSWRKLKCEKESE